jgi:hypothetical protein
MRSVVFLGCGENSGAAAPLFSPHMSLGMKALLARTRTDRSDKRCRYVLFFVQTKKTFPAKGKPHNVFQQLQ